MRIISGFLRHLIVSSVMGFVTFATAASAHAASIKDTNLLAVGQGISSPTSTSTVNYSTGYTSENPIGTIYQNGVRLTGEYDTGDVIKAYGAELGYGQGEWGIAVGHRKADCTGCEGVTAASMGIVVAEVGVGLRFSEDISGAGLLFNPNGTHRVGLNGELNKSGGTGSNVTAYGLGYSYVASAFTFTLDASARTFENSTVNDKRIQLTPGLVLRADIFQVSINDRITLNKDKNNALHNDKDHDIWFGLGFGGDSWHLAIYSEYVNDVAVAGSLFF